MNSHNTNKNMCKRIFLNDIVEFLGNQVLYIHGNPEDIELKYLKDPHDLDEFTLDWINPTKSNKQQIAENTKAKAIISTKDIEYSKTLEENGKVLLIVDDPKLCIAKIANAFFVEEVIPGVHQTSIVHPLARIGQNVFIGPNCIIGKCTIGDNVVLEGNNYLYDNVVIKDNVEIHAGAIIGSEAHNFVEDENGVNLKFPHLGSVIIGENVLVGASSIVSRGVLSETNIGNNTKIAQLVIIGANNIIGENCAIRANTMISGSVTIGNNTIIAPSSTIRDQIKIGSNCFIGMGAVVTKNVPDGETWIGNPARKLR